MDEWSRVRDLAPDAMVTADDLAAARAGLVSAIERAPARRARRIWPRLRLSTGAISAIAAVVVVAVVTAGALVTSQWLGRAPTAGDPDGLDLSAPLLDQLEPGEYLRIASTREASVTGILDPDDPESPVADAYLRVQTVESRYVPADGGAWTVGQPEAAGELVDRVGPDADALAATDAWRRPAEVRTTSDLPAVGLDWLQSLPDDADGLLAAFAELYQSTGETDDTIAQMMLTDPTLVLLTREQRQAFLDLVATLPSFTVTPAGDEIVASTTGVMAPARVTFSGPGLLPLSGEQDMSWMQHTGAPTVPADTWTVDLSIATAVPVPTTAGEAEDPADEPEEPVTDATPDGFWCGFQHIPATALDMVQYAEELDPEAIAALTEAALWPTIAEMPQTWIVVHRDETLIVLFTPEPTMEAGGWLLTGIPPDHQVTTVVSDGAAWQIGSEQLCALQHDLGDLALADVELDPQHLPAAGDTEVRFLVTERDCNSGQSAEGRVELVGGTYEGNVLEVTIGVRPTGEPADCPSNPPTPFVLPLKSPWVEGTVVYDMAYVNGRDLTAP